MSRTTLSFKLPEEQEALYNAQRGDDYRFALSDFNEFLRQKVKYEQLSETEHEIYCAIREKLWEIVNERDLEL